jgi:hypothetical protein
METADSSGRALTHRRITNEQRLKAAECVVLALMMRNEAVNSRPIAKLTHIRRMFSLKNLYPDEINTD